MGRYRRERREKLRDTRGKTDGEEAREDRRGRRWKKKEQRGEKERRGEGARIKERSVGAEETTARVWQKEGKKRSRRSRPGDPQLYTRGYSTLLYVRVEDTRGTRI